MEPHVVRGTFSTVGRSTGREVEKLKGHVEEAGRKLRRASTSQLSLEATGRDGLAAFARKVRESKQEAPPTPSKQDSAPGSAAQKAKPARPPLDDDEPQSPSMLRRSSSAFLNTSMDHERFCDLTCTAKRRFVAPHPDKADKPALGRYNPQYTQIAYHRRMSDTFLGIREKHVGRKEAPPPDLDPSRYQDMSSSRFSFASTAASLSDKEQLALLSPRRPLNESLGRSLREKLHFHEMSPFAGEWGKHDQFSSKRERHPDWDINVHAGEHKMEVLTNYYEPGRYNLHQKDRDSEPTSPKVLTGVKFQRRLSRAESAASLGREGQPAMLQPEGKGVMPDRSLYRTGVQMRRRALSVSDMRKDLDRPDLLAGAAVQVFHDEDDPEADAAVMHRAMTFDASTADAAVIARRDKAPRMRRVIGREAVRGSRLAETDISQLQARGHTGADPETLMDKTVEQLSEAPSQRRRDVAVLKFESYKFRQPTRMHAAAGRTRRARSSAAPDFERTARSGYKAKISLDRPFAISRERFFEALGDETLLLPAEA